jgi:hypothetical protein
MTTQPKVSWARYRAWKEATSEGGGRHAEILRNEARRATRRPVNKKGNKSECGVVHTSLCSARWVVAI